VRAHLVHVCASLQEQLHHRQVSDPGCDDERVLIVLVHRIRVGAHAQEHMHIAHLGSALQRV